MVTYLLLLFNEKMFYLVKFQKYMIIYSNVFIKNINNFQSFISIYISITYKISNQISGRKTDQMIVSTNENYAIY